MYIIFHEHLSGGHLKYSMKNVGRTHVSDNTSLSYFEYVLQHHQEALMAMDEVVVPFMKAILEISGLSIWVGALRLFEIDFAEIKEAVNFEALNL
ncbi:hypothetical protein Scep_020832 [Stephania cephalantha]|uniref:Uncharacterized protein n=1 Tax=Stephania cephalantha TaxID=152367 RepID=A0AAP0F9L7_9MAGN